MTCSRVKLEAYCQTLSVTDRSWLLSHRWIDDESIDSKPGLISRKAYTIYDKHHKKQTPLIDHREKNDRLLPKLIEAIINFTDLSKLLYEPTNNCSVKSQILTTVLIEWLQSKDDNTLLTLHNQDVKDPSELAILKSDGVFTIRSKYVNSTIDQSRSQFIETVAAARLTRYRSADMRKKIYDCDDPKEEKLLLTTFTKYYRGEIKLPHWKMYSYDYIYYTLDILGLMDSSNGEVANIPGTIDNELYTALIANADHKWLEQSILHLQFRKSSIMSLCS